MTNKQVSIARKNWIKAAKKLNFRIVSPYILKVNDFEKEVFAYLPDYGSSKGAIICPTSPPKFEVDEEIVLICKKNGIFYSFINIESCLNYSEQYFREIVEDWVLPI